MPRGMTANIGVDFIHNGEAHGDVAERLLAFDCDPGALRPWRHPRNGRTYVTVVRNGRRRDVRVSNAPTYMTRDAWKQFDNTMLRVALPELRIWGDMVGAGLTYNVPDGMGVTVLEEQFMTQVGNVTVSMDGLRRAERDRPMTDFRNFPLPIIHGDFSFPLRSILVSRRGRIPLPVDTTMLDMTTRAVAEQIEMMALGVTDSYSYGGGTIYGMTNKPQRYTKTMTLPTDSGWTPRTTVDEIGAMIQTLQDDYFNGPYGLYYSRAWSQFLNQDYSDTYAGESLRSRMGEIEDIAWMRKVNFLTGYQMLLWQPTVDVARAVTGMRLTTLQWDTHGGLARNFKVMCIMVPQIRSNASDLTGIVHGVAA